MEAKRIFYYQAVGGHVVVKALKPAQGKRRSSTFADMTTHVVA
jgi:hypothetical protein